MTGFLKISAGAMTVLWIFLISAPLFGADNARCCGSQFCTMKKHGAASAPMSCHQKKAATTSSFKQGACHQEVAPFTFIYNAILPDADYRNVNLPEVVPSAPEIKLSAGHAVPDTPPPELFSA